MAVENNKKLSIMYVLRVLEEYSDENHPLLQSQIIDKIKSNYGLELDRKTIASNIDTLIDELHYDIIKLDRKGCYLGRRLFEPSEVSFLVDALFSSKSISGKRAQELAQKVSSVLSKHQRNGYNYIYKSGEVSRSNNKQIFYTIDVINEAIEGRKQLSFNYIKSFLNKSKEEKHNTQEYIVNPYFMANSQGKYYLMANNSRYGDITNFRIDRISNVKILETDCKPIKEIEGYESGIDIAKYLNDNIYMFSDKTISAKIIVDEEAINYVIDWFGDNARIIEAGDKIIASIVVNEASLVYWALQYAEHVEIIEPLSARECMQEIIKKLNDKYF